MASWDNGKPQLRRWAVVVDEWVYRFVRYITDKARSVS